MHERRHGACQKVLGRVELTLENGVEWNSIDLLLCFGEYSYLCFLGPAERLQSDLCRMSGRGRQQHPCRGTPCGCPALPHPSTPPSPPTKIGTGRGGTYCCKVCKRTQIHLTNVLNYVTILVMKNAIFVRATIWNSLSETVNLRRSLVQRGLSEENTGPVQPAQS